jgi:hypothetical protein
MITPSHARPTSRCRSARPRSLTIQALTTSTRPSTKGLLSLALPPQFAGYGLCLVPAMPDRSRSRSSSSGVRRPISTRSAIAQGGGVRRSRTQRLVVPGASFRPLSRRTSSRNSL